MSGDYQTAIKDTNLKSLLTDLSEHIERRPILSALLSPTLARPSVRLVTQQVPKA
jgi:hypothetical protein